MEAGGRVGIVGDGRVALHMKYYWTQQGLRISQWSRRRELGGGGSPKETLTGCSSVFVALKDSVIEEWILNHQAGLPGVRFFHFSGSLQTPLALGLHPLSTFGTKLYSLEEYRALPFVCEKGCPSIAAILPGLNNPQFEIRPEDKPFYHALCVLSGNFTVLLWQKIFSEFEVRLGIPASVARPYLGRITKNLTDEWKSALTGPIQRSDVQTLRGNLEALSGDEYSSIFRSFVETFVPQFKESLVGETLIKETL